MNYRALFALILAGIVLAGCTTVQPPAATTVPTTTPVVTTLVSPVPQPSFELGDIYFYNQYNFVKPTDNYAERFIVDSQSWGIKIEVSPKSDNLESCWFILNVTDVNTNAVVKTLGYGGKYPYEKIQLEPMYKPGPYKFEMAGNLVTVQVTAAKRLPPATRS